ncbi:exosortase H-associated membrane protein [Congregibacter variabilis]|uniref:Exosortase H-associated membrane protein n=1 Tax=Congregibacter variabilis TaxID=3081200 RepID=A0ABZ0I613_9GAMM|nr:exosortase H-associated membrane protein [Congregibacter sp. IMCC43200]
MIDWLGNRPLLRFTLTVFALLPVCFLIWYYLGNFIAAPAVVLIEPVLLGWLGDTIASVGLRGTDMLVMTHYGETGGLIMSHTEAGNQLAYPVNTRTLSYSIPFFTALHIATPMRASWERFAWCLLGLWLLLAIGLISTTLKDLMLGLGAVFMGHEAVPPTDAIALLYQFSTLMVPPLAPVLLWAYTAKDSPAFIGLLPDSLKPAQDKDSNI